MNAHIRSVADDYAREGFLAVAPALFDRIQRDVELGYAGEDLQKAMSFVPKLNIDDGVKDVAAALDYARNTSGKKAGVIGYCYGGSLAWLAATRLNPDAAVGYYGGQIGKFADENPSAPVMLHFGRKDSHIPPEVAEKVQAAHPAVEIYWYDAGHAFNCEPGRVTTPRPPARRGSVRWRSLSSIWLDGALGGGEVISAGALTTRVSANYFLRPSASSSCRLRSTPHR